MTIHLSKSKILSGLQCPRRLWLEKNRPDLLEITPDTARRFRMGHQLNDVVHTQFPGGILIENDDDLARTQRSAHTCIARILQTRYLGYG